MSFFVAALWSISARLLFDFIALGLISARHSDRLDLVSQVLCQGVAFLATLYVVVVMHHPDRPLSDVLGLRRTRVSLCLVAAALGLALHGPLTLISNVIYTRYPPSDAELENMRYLFTAEATHQKVALVLAAGVFGPVVEEMFFRGGILRSLRRVHTSGLTLLGTSLLFAAAHLDPRSFLPVFLGGLAMGYVRILSGSLWPAILLHAAFNSGSVIVAIVRGPDADLLTRPQSLAAVPVALGLFALYGTLALRSELCSEARAQDVS
jgi:membrane protease YdiL (CAAX protease family)